MRTFCSLIQCAQSHRQHNLCTCTAVAVVFLHIAQALWATALGMVCLACIGLRACTPEPFGLKAVSCNMLLSKPGQLTRFVSSISPCCPPCWCVHGLYHVVQRCDNVDLACRILCRRRLNMSFTCFVGQLFACCQLPPSLLLACCTAPARFRLVQLIAYVSCRFLIHSAIIAQMCQPPAARSS